MNEQRLQGFSGYAGSGSLAADRNRVLRNTYWLLALSMVPTVLGAWVGVSTGITTMLGNGDRKSTRLNSSHIQKSRMPSSA